MYRPWAYRTADPFTSHYRHGCRALLAWGCVLHQLSRGSDFRTPWMEEIDWACMSTDLICMEMHERIGGHADWHMENSCMGRKAYQRGRVHYGGRRPPAMCLHGQRAPAMSRRTMKYSSIGWQRSARRRRRRREKGEKNQIYYTRDFSN